MDLSHLSEQERNAILKVLRRDEDLRRKEEQRLHRMKAELQWLRKRGALKSGYNSDLSCCRCRVELGRILNRGAVCCGCQGKVCKSCRVYAPNNEDWLCVVCHKQMELQAASGEWMNEFVRRPSRRRENRNFIPPTDIIKRSIRSSHLPPHGSEYGGSFIRDEQRPVHRTLPTPPCQSQSISLSDERLPLVRSQRVPTPEAGLTRMELSATGLSTGSRTDLTPSPRTSPSPGQGSGRTTPSSRNESPSPQKVPSPLPRQVPSPLPRPESGHHTPSPIPSPRQRSPLQKQHAISEAERNLSNESQDSVFMGFSQSLTPREVRKLSDVSDSGFDQQGSPKTSRSSEHSRQSSGMSSHTDSRDRTGESFSGSDLTDSEDLESSSGVVFHKVTLRKRKEGSPRERHPSEGTVITHSTPNLPLWGQIGGAHSLPRAKARTVHSISMPFYQYSSLGIDLLENNNNIDGGGGDGGGGASEYPIDTSHLLVGACATLPRTAQAHSLSRRDLVLEGVSYRENTLVLRPLETHRRTPTGSPVVKRIRRNRRETVEKRSRLRSPDRLPCDKENKQFNYCSHFDCKDDLDAFKSESAFLTTSLEDLCMVAPQFEDDDLATFDSVTRSFHSDSNSDILLNVTDKIVPEGDDYKLVFISSSSSKSSGLNSIDSGSDDTSVNSSRRVSSLLDENEGLVYIGEADWEAEPVPNESKNDGDGKDDDHERASTAKRGELNPSEKLSRHAELSPSEMDTLKSTLVIRCEGGDESRSNTYHDIIESFSPTHSLDEMVTCDHVLLKDLDTSSDSSCVHLTSSEDCSFDETAERLCLPGDSVRIWHSPQEVGFTLKSNIQIEDGATSLLTPTNQSVQDINSQELGGSYLEPSSSCLVSAVHAYNQAHGNYYFSRSDSARSSGERSIEEMCFADHVFEFPSRNTQDFDSIKSVVSEINSYMGNLSDYSLLQGNACLSDNSSVISSPNQKDKIFTEGCNHISLTNEIARPYSFSADSLSSGGVESATSQSRDVESEKPINWEAAVVKALESTSALSASDVSEIDTCSSTVGTEASVIDRLELETISSNQEITLSEESTPSVDGEWEYTVMSEQSGEMAVEVNIDFGADTESQIDANVETQSIHCTVDDDSLSTCAFSEDGTLSTDNLDMENVTNDFDSTKESIMTAVVSFDEPDNQIQSTTDVIFKPVDLKMASNNSISQLHALSDSDLSTETVAMEILSSESSSETDITVSNVSIRPPIKPMHTDHFQNEIKGSDVMTSEFRHINSVFSADKEGDISKSSADLFCSIRVDESNWLAFPEGLFMDSEDSDDNLSTAKSSETEMNICDAEISSIETDSTKNGLFGSETEHDFLDRDTDTNTESETSSLKDTENAMVLEALDEDTASVANNLSPSQTISMSPIEEENSGNLVYYLGPQGAQKAYLVKSSTNEKDSYELGSFEMKSCESLEDLKPADETSSSLELENICPEDRVESDTDSLDTVIECETFTRMRQLAIRQKILVANMELESDVLQENSEEICPSNELVRDIVSPKSFIDVESEDKIAAGKLGPDITLNKNEFPTIHSESVDAITEMMSESSCHNNSAIDIKEVLLNQTAFTENNKLSRSVAKMEESESLAAPDTTLVTTASSYLLSTDRNTELNDGDLVPEHIDGADIFSALKTVQSDNVLNDFPKELTCDFERQQTESADGNPQPSWEDTLTDTTLGENKQHNDVQNQSASSLEKGEADLALKCEEQVTQPSIEETDVLLQKTASSEEITCKQVALELKSDLEKEEKMANVVDDKQSNESLPVVPKDCDSIPESLTKDFENLFSETQSELNTKESLIEPSVPLEAAVQLDDSLTENVATAVSVESTSLPKHIVGVKEIFQEMFPVECISVKVLENESLGQSKEDMKGTVALAADETIGGVEELDSSKPNVGISTLQHLIEQSRQITQSDLNQNEKETTAEPQSVLEKYFTMSLSEEKPHRNKIGKPPYICKAEEKENAKDEMESPEIDSLSEITSEKCESETSEHLDESIDDSDTTFSESSDEAYFDREEELRGFSRTIDLSLHTIIEESCEESEAEEVSTKNKLLKPDPSDLEKYFSYTIGDTQRKASNEDSSEFSDTYSETSSSIYSEGIDQIDEDIDPAVLASSRLEKYFMTGFLGLERYKPFEDPEATDECSENESIHNSPHSKRRIIHKSSAEHKSRKCAENPSTSPNRPLRSPSQASSSSTLSDTDDRHLSSEDDGSEVPFEKNDGFDTIKRKKKLESENAEEKAHLANRLQKKEEDKHDKKKESDKKKETESKDVIKKSSKCVTVYDDTLECKEAKKTNECLELERKEDFGETEDKPFESLDELKDIIITNDFSTNVQQTIRLLTAENLLAAGNAISELDKSKILCGLDRKQQSRDSGFIGSSDDLLKDSTDELDDSVVDETLLGASSTLSKVQPEIVLTVDSDPSNDKPEESQVNKKVVGRENSGSDDETRYIVSQLMDQITKSLTVRINGSPPLPRAKPPQLEAFEAELTKLMQTVPGIDATVKEIVEELSSTDYYSDSYESSDYTSSEPDGPSRLGFLRRSLRSSMRSSRSTEDGRLYWPKDSGSVQDMPNMVSDLPGAESGLREPDDELRGESPFTRDTLYIYEKLMLSLSRMAEQASKESSDSEPPGNQSPSSTRSHPSATLRAVQHIRERLTALMYEVHSNGEGSHSARVRRNNSSSSSSSWMGTYPMDPNPTLHTLSTGNLDRGTTDSQSFGTLHADITRWLAKQPFHSGDEQSISSTSSTNYESEDSPTDTELSIDSDDVISPLTFTKKDSKLGKGGMPKLERSSSDITIVDDDLSFRSLDTPETLFATHKIGEEPNPYQLENKDQHLTESSLNRLKTLQERGVMDLHYFVTQGTNNEYEVWQSLVIDEEKFKADGLGSVTGGKLPVGEIRSVARARHLLDSLKSSSSDTLQCISEEDLDSKPSSSRTSVIGSSTNIWSSQSSLAEGKRGSMEALGSPPPPENLAQSPLPISELDETNREYQHSVSLPTHDGSWMSVARRAHSSGHLISVADNSISDEEAKVRRQYRSSFHTEVLGPREINLGKECSDFRSSFHLWVDGGSENSTSKPTLRAVSADPLPQDYVWLRPVERISENQSEGSFGDVAPGDITLSDRHLNKAGYSQRKYATLTKTSNLDSFLPPAEDTRPKASTLPRIGPDLHANVSFLHKTQSSVLTNPPPPTAVPMQYRSSGVLPSHQQPPREKVRSWPEDSTASLESISAQKGGASKKIQKAPSSLSEGKPVPIPQISVSDTSEHGHVVVPPVLGSPSAGSDRESMPEEDIDRLVVLHKTRSSLSSLGTRSDSMTSVYSAAGVGRYGTVVVRGEVLFGLKYNYQAGALEVNIKQCRDLAAVDVKRNRSDPYVKVYLLPDKSKSGKRKTKVKKHTLNPVFDEVLQFTVTISELDTRTLWLTVWHSDMFGRNDFLGEVMFPLGYERFGDPTPQWHPLQERLGLTEEVMSYKGELSLALKYVPPDVTTQKKGKQAKGSLHVLVKEARNLTAANGTSDPFCKSYLLPDKGKSSKQKTHVVKKSCNPKWNHTFVYDDVCLDELKERCLELTVWHYDRLKTNDFLGRVRLSLGIGKYQGKEVDWMDSSGEEMTLWQSMLDHPNMWVDGNLSLK